MTLEFAGGHEEQPWLWNSSTTVRGAFLDIIEDSAIMLLDMESPIILSLDMESPIIFSFDIESPIILLLDMESPIIFPDMDESAIILSAGIELAIILSAMGALDMPPSMEDMSDPIDFLGISPGMHTSFDFLDLNMGILKQVKTLFMVKMG